MNINGLQVDNFGVWSDLTISDLPDDLTVFYGPNEAGKSTLMNFIRTILFGFSVEKCQRFLTGPFGQQRRRMGGRLRINGYEGQYHVRRFADETEPLASAGDVRVTTVSGERAGGHKLAALLSGIDEAIYNNVFCVGMGEIQELSTLNDTQAAQFLYSLSTGTDRVSLVDVMRQLRAARQQLVGNGKPGLLTDLIQQRDKKRRQLEQLGRLTEQWGELRAEVTSLDEGIARLEAQREKLNRHSRTTEIAVALRPKWVRRQALETEIAGLGPPPELPDGIFERLRSIDDRIAHRQRERENLEQRRELLVHNEKDLDVRDGLQRHAARVKALIGQRTWISTLDEEVRRLESRSEEVEFEIQAELEKLGISQPDDGDHRLPTIDTETLSALRGPARLLKTAKRTLDAAKREASTHKAEAEQIAGEMTRQLGGKAELLDARDRGDVDRLMEKTSEFAQNARRRVKLGRDVRDMTERLDELQTSRVRLLQLQFQPRPVIVSLAVVFGLGSILVLSAIFGTAALIDESRRGFLFLVGAVTCGVAVGVKLLLDRTQRDMLDGAERERRELTTRIADADAEISRLDAIIPSGASFDHLLEAGNGADELDQLMPLDTQRRQALDRAAIAEKRAIEIATSMKNARLQWEKALAAVGLSTRLSPSQVEQLAGRAGNLTFLRHQFQDLQDQLERARREVGTVQDRILGLMSEALINPVSERPLEQLDQLGASLREHQIQIAKRSEFRRQIRELRRQGERIAGRVRRLQHKRTSLLTSAGASDDEHLQRLEERRQQTMNLNRQREVLVEDIAAALRASDDEALVRDELQRYGQEELQKRLAQYRDNATQVETQLKERLHRRGELTQQLKSLTANRQLPNAHIELATVERQLKDGLARWKELSATTNLLRRVYKRYEKDRQPETLGLASEFLGRMTGGRYTRIWTPLAEDVLLVDDSGGRSLPIEVLSRGTREQLFLALRLALVSGYARRGIRVPMVLDDVLVNFDVERTVAAVEVLTEFARAGHQLFVFTCHDHIVRVFQDFDAEIRDLPRHDNDVLSSRVVIDRDSLASSQSWEHEPHRGSSHEALPASPPATVAATSVGAETGSLVSGGFLGDAMLPKFATEPRLTLKETAEVASPGRQPVMPTSRPVVSPAATLNTDGLPTTSLSDFAVQAAVVSNSLAASVGQPATTEIDRSETIDKGGGAWAESREQEIAHSPPVRRTSDAQLAEAIRKGLIENQETEVVVSLDGIDVENESSTNTVERDPDEYEYVSVDVDDEEADEEADEEEDRDDEGFEDEDFDDELEDIEYEYVDEDGNIINAEDLTDDEDYEWVEEEE